MKVLIIGHACSPRMGSEPSFTWNWAWQLSRRHQVWVLTHPYDRQGVTEFMAANANANLRFEWVEVSRWLDPWRGRANGKGLQAHYLLWLRNARKKALELNKKIHFDIAHHVSYGTVSASLRAAKLPFPLIWGPLGGAQSSPSSFRRYFGGGWPREIVRNLRVRLLPWSPALRKTARFSTVALATNHETAKLLARVGAQDVRMFLDSGIPQDFLLSKPLPGSKDGELTLLWAGRMLRRKALTLALDALAMINDVPVRLLIAGDGPMRKGWESYANDLNLGQSVQFLGQVPWQEMPRLYQRADAFLFTSLRDSFGTQVLEAMGHGLPILTLDHQGVGTFVPPEAAIKIPVDSPRQTIAALANGIRQLALDPQKGLKVGEAARAFASTQTWEKRAQLMSEIYEEVVARWTKSSPATLRMNLGSMAPQQGGRDAVASASHLAPSSASKQRACFPVLGVRVDAVQIGEVIQQMKEWIREKRGCHSIAATGMHGMVEAQHDPEFKLTLNATDLVVPDGMPLVWLGRRSGHVLPRRVYGPDLLLAFCEKTAGCGYRHFFYGAERDPDVPERLAERLKERFPGTIVAGTYSRPLVALGSEQKDEIISRINRAAPDVLWVGLGELRQVRWMHEHRDKLRVPVVVGVGAAFDMISGGRRQAPRWMREHGFEWLFRLCQEPRRLWRRYLIYGSQFIVWVALESLGLRSCTLGEEESKS